MTTTGFRPDIQGLRAVAVVAVLLYHAGIPGVASGFVGVDVFFVISGYLITSLLLREQRATGTISLSGFYARRARRILPAAIVTVVATVIIALIVIPPLARPRMLVDAAATLLYVPNVLFAVRQNDYLADQTPSLFQHFWSLGVEEQFYLLWPLLLLLVLRFARRPRVVATVIVLLTALSFSFGVVLTTVDQPWAFYSLPTRAWEFGAGAVLALLPASARLPRPLAEAAGWAGLALIVIGAVALPPSVPFPGLAVLLPVVGTALAILAGATPGTTSARALSLRPLLFLGLISYSVYLVHWPLLRLPAAGTDPLQLGPAWPVAACLLAVALGYLLYRLVERPWRTGRLARLPRRAIIAGAVATSVSLVAITGAGAAIAGAPAAAPPASSPTAPPTPTGHPDQPPSADPDDPVVGIPDEVVPADVTPALAEAGKDVAAVYANGCHQQFHQTDTAGCILGAADGPIVALFGDSHAAQWIPALEAGGYRIHSYTKSACPSVSVPGVHHDGTPYPECETWREGVLQRIDDDRPALIILANWSGYVPMSSDPGRWGSGLRTTVTRLAEVAPVAVLDDTPQQRTMPAECLSAHLDDVAACETSPADALTSPLRDAEAEALTRLPAERWTINEWICSGTRCPLIVGGVLRYRDRDHLTATFSRALAPRLALLIDPVTRPSVDGR